MITISIDHVAEVLFVYHEHDNKLSDKKKCTQREVKNTPKIFAPISHELFRVASARVPHRYKEQKDYCLILNVRS